VILLNAEDTLKYTRLASITWTSSTRRRIGESVTIPQPMQGFEIAGLYALIGLAVYALRHRIPELNAAPVWVRLAIGTAVGIILCVPILVRGTNLVPDGLEPAFLIAILAALTALVFWLRR
jgi:hypothetical protein